MFCSNNMWISWYNQSLSEANSHSKNCAMGGKEFWIHNKDYFDLYLLYGKHPSCGFFGVGLWPHFASSLMLINTCDQSRPF